MRVLLLSVALGCLVSCFASAAPAPAPAPVPQRTKFDVGNNDADSQPFIEEVVVESLLHVRTPLAASARQARGGGGAGGGSSGAGARTTHTDLKTGARVAEMRN